MKNLFKIGKSYVVFLVLGFTLAVLYSYPVLGEHDHSISHTRAPSSDANDHNDNKLATINANLKSNMPSVPSLTEQKQLEKIAFSNNQVQKLVDGKQYSIMAIGFKGYAIENPIKWNPVVSINIANTTSVSVVIDNETRSVTMVDSEPLVRIDPQ